MDPEPTPRARRWTRVVPGALLVAVVVIIAVRTWSALLANHPAYPLSLLVALAAGVWLVVSGLRRRVPPRPGAARSTLRVLGALGGAGMAVLLLWLEPFVAEPVAVDALSGSGSVRVDPRAYAVLAGEIAAQGYRVVVVKCAYDLQLLCPDAASAYVDDTIPWAVGGHSLGGVAASSYAKAHADVDGLVLWASFPVEDLAGRTGLAVSSISGDADALSTPAKVDAAKPSLPAGTTFVVVPGAIHSFFGDYGLQPGDGVATTSREAAQRQIVAATVALLERISDPSV